MSIRGLLETLPPLVSEALRGFVVRARPAGG
jgi:hypothetical protein